LIQTEEAQYKLDGSILMIEGMGRNKADGKVALQAFGIVSYDDQANVYRMRAYNDGRWLKPTSNWLTAAADLPGALPWEKPGQTQYCALTTRVSGPNPPN